MKFYIQHILRDGFEMWRAVAVNWEGCEVWEAVRWSPEQAAAEARRYKHKQEVSK